MSSTPPIRRWSVLAFFATVLAVLVAIFWPDRGFDAAPLDSAGPKVPTNVPIARSASDGAPTSIAPQPGGSVIPREVAAFSEWFTEVRRGAPVDIDRGLRLARERRAALKQLIIENPEAALAQAIPTSLWNELPPEIVAELETPVDAFAKFDVIRICSPNHTGIDRWVQTGGRRYRAFVYGQRVGTLSKNRLPVHGIAIDDALAVDEKPYRHVPDPGRPNVLAVAIGDSTRNFASADELRDWSSKVLASETMPDPEADVSGEHSRAAATSAWVAGQKTVLWIRVRFAADNVEPPPPWQIEGWGADTDSYYRSVSGGRTSMRFTVLPVTVQLPKSRADYATNFSWYVEVSDFAVEAARAYDASHGATGAYDPDVCDRWVVVFPGAGESGPHFPWGALANVGSKGVWVNGAQNAYVCTHELGHNQGLQHSHAWVPQNGDPIGAGEHNEYGDPFDVMGYGDLPSGHFNVLQKQTLGYLDASEVKRVTTSGVYRVYRADDPGSGNSRALQIGTGSVPQYWVEARRAVPSFVWQRERLSEGVLVHWGKTPAAATGQGTYLLDMTPSPGGWMYDAPLASGERFVDAGNGITVRPVGSESDWVDVRVDFGASGSNHNPVLTLAAQPATVAARTDVTFSATATDPDGDPMNIRWEFGDAPPVEGASVTRRWLVGGVSKVRCIATDGKGGIAQKEFDVQVTDVLSAFTERATTTAQLNAITFGAGQFVAVGWNGTGLISPDAVRWSRTEISDQSSTAVAYGAGRYVAVGTQYDSATQSSPGSIHSSVNGQEWRRSQIDQTSKTLEAVTYGASRWIAVGGDGAILVSEDGLSWKKVNSGTTSWLTSIAYSDGMYVAVGYSGCILTSRDGVTWLNRSVTTNAGFAGVARHNGAWFVSSGYETWSSPNAESWTRVPGAGTHSSINGIVYSAVAGAMLAPCYSGELFVTETGADWGKIQIEPVRSGMGVVGVAEGNGTVAAITTNKIFQAGAVPVEMAQFSPEAPLPDVVSPGRGVVVAAKAQAGTVVQFAVDGVVVAETKGANPTITWTPERFGATRVTLRTLAQNGRVFETTHTVTVGLEGWKWHNPKLACGSLLSVRFALGRWWAGGEAGAFLTSEDGKTWTSAPPPTKDPVSYRDIATDGNRMVVAGRPYRFDGSASQPVMWTTTNGTDWTPIGGRGLPSITEVAWNGELWVALGFDSFLTSKDGLNWTRGTSIATQSNFATFGYGGDRWTAISWNNRFYTSTDAINWSEVQVSGFQNVAFYDMAWLNGRWVAGGTSGRIATSTDGIHWESANIGSSSSIQNVFVHGDRFVAVGDGGLTAVSKDGLVWTLIPNSRGMSLMGAASNGAKMVAVGSTAEIQYGDVPEALRTVDASERVSTMGMAAEGARVILVGAAYDYGNKKTGYDVAEARGGGITPGTFVGDFQWRPWMTAVGMKNGVSVLVGSSGFIFSSRDGKTWEYRKSGTNANLNAVTGGGDGFVVVGESGTILTSPDGTTWTARTSGVGARFRAITRGAGQYVAVGDAGALVTSPDGIEWTDRHVNDSDRFRSIAWSERTGFVAVGDFGAVWRSVDGVAWTKQPIRHWMSYVAGTRFGIIGGGSSSLGNVWVSGDGATWMPCAAPTEGMNAIAADDTMVWLGGEGGRLVSSAFVDGPKIASGPLSQTLMDGQAAKFAVTANGTGTLTYQWYRDGRALAGATGPVLSLSKVGFGDAGSYTVMVTDALGFSTTSSSAPLQVVPPTGGRLSNMSVRTKLAAGQTLIVGFVTTDTKSVVIRAVGPTLAGFGVTGYQADPKLELRTASGELVAANDNWTSDLTPTFASLGAFPLALDGKDAALSRPIRGSSNALARGDTAGTALVELYDAGRGTQPRLANVSARNVVGTGDDILIAGFVVDCPGTMRLLIRAVGPKLKDYGVGGTLVDPKLTIYDSAGNVVAVNDNWSDTAGGSAQLSAAMTATGAFALDSGSKDAAVLVALLPGSYTAHVTGADGGTGEALVEVYHVE